MFLILILFQGKFWRIAAANDIFIRFLCNALSAEAVGAFICITAIFDGVDRRGGLLYYLQCFESFLLIWQLMDFIGDFRNFPALLYFIFITDKILLNLSRLFIPIAGWTKCVGMWIPRNVEDAMGCLSQGVGAICTLFLQRHNIWGTNWRINLFYLAVDFLITNGYLRDSFIWNLNTLFTIQVNSETFTLHSVSPLPPPVGMCYLYLLQQVLHWAQFFLNTNTLQPFVILLDDILYLLMFIIWLFFTNGKFTHQFVCKFTFPFALAVLAKEVRVVVLYFVHINLGIQFALNILVWKTPFNLDEQLI